MGQVEECVDQLQQAASSRQIETGDLEAGKTNQEQKRKHLQGDIEKLNDLKQVEVALGRKDAAEKQLGILKKIQQEKFGEEERRVVLQGQVQVACEQVKLKKEGFEALESQVESEQANLQRLRTESHTLKERKLSCCAKKEKLHTMVAQNREENSKMFETRMKTTEKAQLLRQEGEV